MLSHSASISLSNRSNDPVTSAIIDIEQQIRILDDTIASLLVSKKQLKKVEEQIHETNMLIDSGIGSKKAQLV